MRALGEALGMAAMAGDLFLLVGPFGAGKTTFVQGLATGLGVSGSISSPSFVIENQYQGRLVLYHVDLYRLEHPEPDLLQSIEEHLYGEGVTVVEWAERLPEDLREGATTLTIKPRNGNRRVQLCTHEERLRAAAQTW
jgi:tRNA threonylcarbamoyladenosine biosynthesis protein TsaE